MEAGSLERLVDVGISVAGLMLFIGAYLGGAAGIGKIIERQSVVDRLMPLYKSGDISVRPNVFNVYNVLDSLE